MLKMTQAVRGLEGGTSILDPRSSLLHPPLSGPVFICTVVGTGWVSGRQKLQRQKTGALVERWLK